MTPTRRSLLAAALTLPAAPFLARLARAAAPVDVAGPAALEGAIRAAAPGTVLRLAPGSTAGWRCRAAAAQRARR